MSVVRSHFTANKEAAELAMRAFPDAERAAYQRGVEQLLAAGHSAHVVLLGSESEGRLQAAQLGHVLPGRAAVVWAPQFVGGDQTSRVSLAHSFFERMVRELAAAGAQVAQALVHTTNRADEELLATGGFERVADLLYLAVNLDQPYDMQPRLPFEIEAFTAAAGERLAKLIDRTYVGTMDCPRLDGLRETKDVIVGYQSVGVFREELWLIARHRGADVGCLLINLHPDVRHAEVVYVALVPEVRGRGWGAELMRVATWLGRRAFAERVVLAVDSANEPAIAMYQSLGFFEFDRRAVWIREIPKIPKSL